jgi:hypothetical protein
MSSAEATRISVPGNYDFGTRTNGESHGVVLTKRHIAELILDLAGYVTSEKLYRKRLLEPACGHGAFLVPAVERLISSLPRGKSLASLKDAIRAYDIDPEHVARTKECLVDTIVSYGHDVFHAIELVDEWVHQGDFLLAEVPGHFDTIAGNPPYVRIEQIAPELQIEYRQRFSTIFDRADLYVAFIERGLNLLSPKGILSYICADRWILNRYGAPLRQIVTEQFSLRAYVDLHDASPFESEVIAYPSIFVIGKGKTENVSVFKMKTADADECRSVAQTFLHGKDSVGLVLHTVCDVWFNGDEPWTIGSPEHLVVLRDLESRFETIEHNERAKVRIGVATGNDSVFIVNEQTSIERDRLLPLVMRSDLSSGSIRDAKRFVINTFKDEGGLVDLEHFPRLKDFFFHHEEKVSERHVAKSNPKGWFRTIDRVYPEIVGQPKLLIPDIAGSNEVTFDPGSYFPHHNLYYVLSSQWDLEVLGGLLSSKVALFFIWSYAVKMRGGYLRFQAQYLRRIRVPDPAKLNKHLQERIKHAFKRRDFATLDELALQAYELKHFPAFDFVDTRK